MQFTTEIVVQLLGVAFLAGVYVTGQKVQAKKLEEIHGDVKEHGRQIASHGERLAVVESWKTDVQDNLHRCPVINGGHNVI